MPDGKTHVIAGTICATIGSITVQKRLHENEKLALGELLLSTGAGAAASRLPDILEPPLNPNHRAFFHSYAAAALLGFSAVKIWKKLKEMSQNRKVSGIRQISWQEITLGLILVGIVAFLVHLIMDGFTKKGLPPI